MAGYDTGVYYSVETPDCEGCTDQQSSIVQVRDQENVRLNKWRKMLESWDKYYPNEKAIWLRLLDVARIKAEQEGKYLEMRERARMWSPDIRQIDLDVNRTYRNHIMFRERYSVK
ncbi:hypothetical protein HPB51_010464 [Rhipicephalus microplus]|uniref:Rab-GAP TBC domain-containing protein n=1 Tax=Rhipicephalus microplus TaxID=6941 RepID=A0A9J6E0S3_RHIMP|nr:hypothetical protein HPB51_010464 [Rhipicephalus microplus]